MIQISGPHHSIQRVNGKQVARDLPPLSCEAATLGEAIAIYASTFGVTVRPCQSWDIARQEGKYFDILDPQGEVEWVVDIHVLRGQEEICPKQDLAFPLQDGDLISMGVPAC